MMKEPRRNATTASPDPTHDFHKFAEVPLQHRRRKTASLRPVFPKLDWMICPNVLAYFMAWYGLLIGKFPIQIMSMTIGLSVIFCVGFSRLKFSELKTDDFLPTDSPSSEERMKTIMFDYSDGSDPTDYVSVIRPTLAPFTTQRRATTPPTTAKQVAVITTMLTPQDNLNNRQKRDTVNGPDGVSLTCRISALLIVARKNTSDPTGKSYNLYDKSMLKEIDGLEKIIYDMGVDVRSTSGYGGVYRYENRDNNSALPGVCTINPSNRQCGGFTLRVLRGLFKTEGDVDPLTLVFSKLPGFGLTWPRYQTYDLSSFFGRVETVDGKPNSMVKHIGAMREVYCITDWVPDDYFARYAKIWELWEQKFDKTVRQYKSKYFDVYWGTEYQKQAQQAELMGNMVPKLGITFIAVMIWCFVGAMMVDAVRAKPWAGLIGVVSTLIACAAGFGIGLWIDPGFKVILMALPLMTLAIGLDDMFIMLEAWSETNHMLPVEERMMLAMNTGGTSIVITFIINLLDFIIGSYTPFPIVQLLSKYAIATMTYDFICQMTIFGPCLVLFGRNEHNNNHSVCCCIKLSSREKVMNTASPMSLVCCAGGFSDSGDVEDQSRLIGDQAHVDKEEDSKVASLIVRVLISLPTRIVIVFCFVAYVAGAIFSLTQLELGLKPERIYRTSTNLYDLAYYNRILFTGYGKEVVVVVTNELDYSSPQIRQRLKDMVDKVENCGFFWDGAETKFWVRDFENWAASSHVNLSSLTNNKEVLLEVRKPMGFLDSSNPVTFESYSSEATDIRMKKNGSTITKSRFKFRAKDMSSPSRQVGMMETIRRILRSYAPDIVMYAYMDEFQLYDQFLSAVPATLYYGGLTLGVTIGVAIFMIPHPACLFWVSVFVTTILLGIIGLMRPWGMDLDSVSLINLLVAISFCSDLIAHPIYIFMVTPPVGKTGKLLTGNKAREAKAEAVVKEVLAAAVPACVGTTLSMIAMSNSDAYVFITFFRTMFLSVILSILHALIFIPAFLSFIGPSETQIQGATGDVNLKNTPEQESSIKNTKSSTRKLSSRSDDAIGDESDNMPIRIYSNRTEMTAGRTMDFTNNAESNNNLSRPPHFPGTKKLENQAIRRLPILKDKTPEFHPVSNHWSSRRVFRLRGGFGALKDVAQKIRGSEQSRADYSNMQLPPTIAAVPANPVVTWVAKSQPFIKLQSETIRSSVKKTSFSSNTGKLNSTQRSTSTAQRSTLAPPVTSYLGDRLRRWQPPLEKISGSPMHPAVNMRNLPLPQNVTSVSLSARLGAAMLPAKQRFNL